MASNPTPDRTPYCHKIRYGITGAPILDGDDMDGSHAPGVGVVPKVIELVYSPARDGKPASVAASVTGTWTRFGERAPSHARMTTHFTDGPEDWPAWLAEEARLHDPAAAPSVSAVDQTTRDRIAEALDALQGTAHHLPPKTRERVEEVMAGALARVLPSDGHATAKPMGRGVKAEALLLHFTAEAHRRKWDYDRGLDDDGVPIKSEAFDALHRLGDEMNAALHKLRATPAAVLPPPADRAAVLREAADRLWALANRTTERGAGVLWAADWLRRLADEATPVAGSGARANGTAATVADEAQQPAVGARQPDTETPKRASRWGVCDGCGAAAGPDCDCPPDTGDDHSCAESGCTGEPTVASSAVPGRSAATSTDEEQPS